jgi:hypothetical protein
MKVIDFVNKVKHYMESAGYKCFGWNYHGYDDPDIASQLKVEDSFENSFEFGYKLGETYPDKLSVLIADVDFTFDDDISSRKNYSFEESRLAMFRRCVLDAILDIGWVKTFTAYINGYNTASTSNRSHMMFTTTIHIITKCDAEALKTLLNTNWDQLSVIWYEETNDFYRMSHAEATEYYALYNSVINSTIIGNWNKMIELFDQNNAIECKAIVIKWKYDKYGEKVSEDMKL